MPTIKFIWIVGQGVSIPQIPLTEKNRAGTAARPDEQKGSVFYFLASRFLFSSELTM